MFLQLAAIYIFIIVGSIYCDTNDDLTCGINSSPHLCGKSCEPTCNNPLPAICHKLPCSANTKSCRCNKGFVRDINTGKCVKFEQCSHCPHGEILMRCGPQCEGTCRDPHTPEICQNIECTEKICGCDINEGFVRDDFSKTCVQKRVCKQILSYHN